MIAIVVGMVEVVVVAIVVVVLIEVFVFKCQKSLTIEFSLDMIG